MTVQTDRGIDRVAADLEGLRARIDGAKAEAAARTQATAAEAQERKAPTPLPPSAGPGSPPWRGKVALGLALALILLAVAATAIISGDDRSDSRVSEPAAVSEGTAAVEPAFPDRATGPATGPVAPPVAPDGAVPSSGPPAAYAPVRQPSPGAAAQATMPELAILATSALDGDTSVVVEVGDSFWSLAEGRVTSGRGSPPTTAEVTAYWTDLVEANRHRLADASNPDLIYPGQTFSLP